MQNIVTRIFQRDCSLFNIALGSAQEFVYSYDSDEKPIEIDIIEVSKSIPENIRDDMIIRIRQSENMDLLTSSGERVFKADARIQELEWEEFDANVLKHDKLFVKVKKGEEATLELSCLKKESSGEHLKEKTTVVKAPQGPIEWKEDKTFIFGHKYGFEEFYEKETKKYHYYVSLKTDGEGKITAKWLASGNGQAIIESENAQIADCGKVELNPRKKEKVVIKGQGKKSAANIVATRKGDNEKLGSIEASVYKGKEFYNGDISLVYVNGSYGDPDYYKHADTLKHFFNKVLKPAIVRIKEFNLISEPSLYDQNKNDRLDVTWDGGALYGSEYKRLINQLKLQLGGQFTCEDDDLKQQRPAIIITENPIRTNFVMRGTTHKNTRVIKLSNKYGSDLPLDIGTTITVGPSNPDKGGIFESRKIVKISRIIDVPKYPNAINITVNSTFTKDHPVYPDVPQNESHICFADGVLPGATYKACNVCPKGADTLVILHEFLHGEIVGGLTHVENPENIMNPVYSKDANNIHQFYGQWDALNKYKFGEKEGD